MDWVLKKIAGYKTYGVAWSTVLVVLVDLLGWYDVPEVVATPTMAGAALVAALVVTFGKIGLEREIRAAGSKEA